MKVTRHYPWLLGAAVPVWFAVGVAAMALEPDARTAGGSLAVWLLLFAVFAVAVAGSAAVGRRSPLAQVLLIGLESLAVVGLAAVPHRGDPGPLLAPIALQAALVFGARPALGLVAAQSMLIWVSRASYLADSQAWFYWVVNVAAELIAVGVVALLRREAETAAALARSNGELRATQALLAESAAAAERLRISRELHDAWGHDLTVLSLQLEYASHIPPQDARASVLEARDLTRSLLGKVRDVVGALRRVDGHDIKPILEALAQGAPQLKVHLDIPSAIALQPAETAQTLMRSAQEIITNTLRHAGARNLWLSLEAEADGVRLISRDDGRGAERFRLGNGLSGVRERFEQHGGRIVFESGRGQGFRVSGWLPAPKMLAPKTLAPKTLAP
ncbi:sensor histidine kinase [Phenylobacterium sp.]|jgi:signal transduction histidine kinase|uniref:sensor histidine kinase n=1 Tax=Phenylobacterium sp. TaxID=1871053 RepID=UPI002F4165CE